MLLFKVIRQRIGLKLLLIAVGCVISAVVALTLAGAYMQANVLTELSDAKHLKSSETLAARFGPAIKFKQNKSIIKTFDEIVKDPSSALSGYLILDKDGKTVLSSSGEEYAKLDFDQIQSELILDNSEVSHQILDGRFVTYSDIIFKKPENIIGKVVVFWNYSAVNKTVNSMVMNTIIIGLLIILMTSTLLWVIFSKMVSKPVSNLTSDMNSLVAGNTDMKFDMAKRTDEIGKMFQAVIVFRDAAIEKENLELASETSRVRVEQERAERESQKADDAMKLNEAIEALASGLASLSDGNLTTHIDKAFDGNLDLLRSDFNSSVAKLNTIMSQINTVSVDLRDSSSEIANATSNLSQRTESQAATIEETSAALEEITVTVTQTSERAKEVAAKAKEAQSDTEQSSMIVADAILAMEGIERASGNIKNILNVMDEIAFQTNLLALNAGVEAARAGEAGKGFAVVAQEVRELAQRSATAAKEIKELIAESSREVSNGVDLVNKTSEALSKISGNVTLVNTEINIISNGAADQLLGIQEINNSMSIMDNVTQQNAAMVEENTAVTHEMSDKVSALAQMVSTFQTDSRAAEQNETPEAPKLDEGYNETASESRWSAA